MAYHHLSLSRGADIPRRIFDGIASFAALVGTSIIAASSANRRLRLVEQLNEKSDAELAVMGIKREDIVRRVFIDMVNL